MYDIVGMDYPCVDLNVNVDRRHKEVPGVLAGRAAAKWRPVL